MAEEKKSGRTYHVLRPMLLPSYPDREFFERVAQIEASSPTQAITLTVYDFGRGEYVAVPDGNWTEEAYEVEPRPPKITKVDSGWKWDDAPATAAVEDGVVLTEDENAVSVVTPKEQHSVAVGEQETIDDDVDRAAIRRAAAAERQ